MERKNW